MIELQATHAQAATFRLRRQGLTRSFATPEQAVEALVAVQCQMPSACRQALAVRCPGFGRDAWDQLLYERRSVVRTWANRGTVHLLPTATRDKVLAALWRRDGKPAGGWWTNLPISDDLRENIVAAMLAALADGPLDRDPFKEAVNANLPAEAHGAARELWSPLLQYATRTGRVCFGPPNGQQVTFVRVDQWVGPATEEDPDEARAWLAEQFLRTYGPAQVRDMAYWTGLRSADCIHAVKTLGDAVVTVEVDRTKELLLAEDADELVATEAERSAVLVPHFDNYVLWRKSKGDLVDEAWHPEVWRKAAWVAPVAVVDGRVAGTWRVDRTASTASFTVAQFGSIPAAAKRRLCRAAGRRAELDGLSAEVIYEDASPSG